MNLRVPGGLVVLVALGSAVSVAVAAMPIVSRLSAADRVWTAATHDAPQSVAGAGRVDLSPILDFAPFGHANVQTASVGEPKAVKQSALILQGVSTSPNPANSRAIIAADGGQSESYAIGDTVAPGQILSGIATDHVSLAVGGETLSLGFPADAAAPRGADAAPAGSTRLQNLIPAADPVPDGPAGMIKALREEVQRNPQRVLDRYGITATGQGYLIGQSTPADLLQVGLQPGDLVTDLNGHKVGSILADRSFLDEVAASGQAQIVVLRAGKPVALSVPFQ